jgi:hypothetical protein
MEEEPLFKTSTGKDAMKKTPLVVGAEQIGESVGGLCLPTLAPERSRKDGAPKVCRIPGLKAETWEPLAELPSGYGLCQGTTSVVPQMANLDSGFSRCGLQVTGSKTAGAKAIRDSVSPSARLKSCPDTSCSLNGMLQGLLGHPD